MREKMAEIIDYLYLKNCDKEEISGIITPLRTVQMIDKMIEWLKKNPQATLKEMINQSLTISEQ